MDQRKLPPDRIVEINDGRRVACANMPETERFRLCSTPRETGAFEGRGAP
jgi:hypothetical protein